MDQNDVKESLVLYLARILEAELEGLLRIRVAKDEEDWQVARKKKIRRVIFWLAHIH